MRIFRKIYSVRPLNSPLLEICPLLINVIDSFFQLFIAEKMTSLLTFIVRRGFFLSGRQNEMRMRYQ